MPIRCWFLCIPSLLCAVLAGCSTSSERSGQSKKWECEFSLQLVGSNGVYSIAVTPDGKTAYAFCRNQNIYIIDLDNRKIVDEYEQPGKGVYRIAINHAGTLIAISAGRAIQLWTLRDKVPVGELQGHKEGITQLAFAPKDDILASASADATVRLWDLAKQTQQAVLRGHSEAVKAIAFSRDGTLLASGAFDKSVIVWDVGLGKEKHVLRGHKWGVRCVTFVGDGHTVAAGGESREIKLWDADSGAALRTLTGELNVITQLASSRDGQRLIAANVTGFVAVWDLRNDQELYSFRTHYASLAGMVYRDADKAIITASVGISLNDQSVDGEVALWKLKD